MKKSTLVLIILLAIFFTSTLVLLFLNFNKKPVSISNTGIIPAEENIPTTDPTADPTADWKTYTNTAFGFSMSYPADLVVTDSLPKKYTNISTTHEYLLLEDKSKSFSFTLMINPDGFGPIFSNKTYSLKYQLGSGLIPTVKAISTPDDNYDKTKDVFEYSGEVRTNFDILVLTYSPKNNSANEKMFNQILSTFEFVKVNNGKGIVSGNLCYPSEGIPPGTIYAKNIVTKEVFTQKYLGTNVDSSSGKFVFSLDPGTYHFKFEVGANAGYYNKCAKTMESNDCKSNEDHQLLDVIVSSDINTTDISICDFYYSTEQEVQMKNTF